MPTPLAALLVELLDGTRDLAALRRDWSRSTGTEAPPGTIEGLVEKLDEALLLENGRAAAARRDALAAWRRLERRPLLCAGASYPAEATPLRARLEAWRRESGADPQPAAVRAVLAPHIDPRGGGPCHGAAAAALAASEANLYVILGTAHHALRRPFALTTLDFDTPAGPLPVDRGAVEHLARRGGGGLLDVELSHAGEHSVEFQAVWLRMLHEGRRDLAIVPVLVGSIGAHIRSGRPPEETPEIADFVAALRELAEERKTAVSFVGSVDFAHVGPNYGDAKAPTPAELEAVMEGDRRLLESVLALDAGGWFRGLSAEQDARNVCGAAPTWVLLATLAGRDLRGRLLRHDVWQIDPATGSHVSFAAVAWHDADGGPRRDGTSGRAGS